MSYSFTLLKQRFQLLCENWMCWMMFPEDICKSSLKCCLWAYKMLIEFKDKKCPCDSYCPLCSFHEQGCYIGRYFLSIILQIYCSSKCLIYLEVENILWGRAKMFILQIFDWIFYVTHLYIYIATEHIEYGHAKSFFPDCWMIPMV